MPKNYDPVIVPKLIPNGFVVVFNPEFTEVTEDFKKVSKPGASIIGYLIAEAKTNMITGEIYENTDYKPPDNYDKSGRTLKWSIRKGETLRFPAYVARVLKRVYPFLELKDDDETIQKAEPS